MNETAYCLHCGERTEFEIEIDTVYIITKTAGIKTEEETARCKKCGNPLYVAAVNDRNVERRLEAIQRFYRSATDE